MVARRSPKPCLSAGSIPVTPAYNLIWPSSGIGVTRCPFKAEIGSSILPQVTWQELKLFTVYMACQSSGEDAGFSILRDEFNSRTGYSEQSRGSSRGSYPRGRWFESILRNFEIYIILLRIRITVSIADSDSVGKGSIPLSSIE